MTKPPKRPTERVVEPTDKLLSREAKKLQGGDPAAGRILAEASVAARQKAKKKKP